MNVDDFDRLINRENTGSLKWDARGALFGSDDVIPMWVADMDFAAPPAVIRALEERVRHGIFGYAVRPAGYLQALKGWIRDRQEWTVREEWLLVSPGVVPSMSLILQVFTEPGDRILVQSPVYHLFYEIIRRNRRTVAESPLVIRNGRYEMDFDDLERHMKQGVTAMFLCSPHNPVGRVWTREELRRLAELCERYGVLVISDEIHGDLVYPPCRHIPFASLDDGTAERTIVCTAPSKTFNLAGLQTSVMIVPEAKIRTKLKNEITRLALFNPNVLSLTAAEAAYRHGGAWLDSLLSYLQRNIRDVERAFAEEDHITVFRPEGTYLVWLDFRKPGQDAKSLEKRMMQKAKVGLSPGSQFGTGGEGFMRMNVACPRSTLTEALERIRREWGR